ncbi:MAG TPA: hydrogenase maturation nickel metallochaperone HypA [Vulgatibacter sp.]|nr:hydrogenase maturation nickel metallochaperone HypA [Vulgatibacter sp.]
MHELSLMEDLVTTIEQKVERGRVAAVHLEIGRLSAVVPDALRFCFEVCAQGTRLEGAELCVREVPGRARCRACGAEQEIDLLPPPCACGSIELQVIAGRELRLEGVEVI